MQGQRDLSKLFKQIGAPDVWIWAWETAFQFKITRISARNVHAGCLTSGAVERNFIYYIQELYDCGPNARQGTQGREISEKTQGT